VSDALRKRIITAVVLAAAALAILLGLPPPGTVILVTAVVLAGAWEWSAFLRLPGAAPRVAYVCLILVLLYAVWRLCATAEARQLLLGLAMLWWLAALAWITLAPQRAATWSAALAGILALVPAWFALVRLRYAPEQGAEWVVFALLLVWVADIGAFFCGRRFGRLRLAPVVSPAKTWEGVLGAMVVSAAFAVLGGLWFRMPLAVFLPLCLAAVAFSIVGDLTESLLKRFAGVKDSGTVFPGHGGVMDRIDSITGAAPVLVLGLMALGVVP
jgi:phosphatidate cytidylyltransferase